MTLDKTMQATIRAWGRTNGFPLLGKSGRLPNLVIDAYWAAHPEHVAAVEAAQDAGDELDEEPFTLDDAPLDDDAYTVIVNAWTSEHADLIAWAAAGLIGAIRDSERERITTLLAGLPPCRGITEAITLIGDLS